MGIISDVEDHACILHDMLRHVSTWWQHRFSILSPSNRHKHTRMDSEKKKTESTMTENESQQCFKVFHFEYESPKEKNGKNRIYGIDDGRLVVVLWFLFHTFIFFFFHSRGISYSLVAWNDRCSQHATLLVTLHYFIFGLTFDSLRRTEYLYKYVVCATCRKPNVVIPLLLVPILFF